MGTCCGDSDPALVTYLMRKKRLNISQMDDILYKESGLKKGGVIMRRVFLVLFLLAWGFLFSVSIYAQEKGDLKKVVMIIADQFSPDELFPTKAVLENRDIEVKVASTVLTPVNGAGGKVVKPDILLSDINIQDFQAIVFVGGYGATQYLDDPVAHQLIKDAFKAGKIVAAMSFGPMILAKAGILTGKRATVSPSSQAEILKSYGANYTGSSVEKDGNIITALGGVDAAMELGDAIVEALTK